MKKQLLSLTLTLLCFTKIAFAFPDTSSHWSSSEINACVDNGYMIGYDDGNFYPYKHMTFGEFSVVICNAYYNGKTNPKNTDTHWSDPYLNMLTDNGLFISSSGVNYAPKNDTNSNNSSIKGDRPISTGAVMAVINNLMIKGSGFVTIDTTPLGNSLSLQMYNDFREVGSLNDYWNAIANDIISGYVGKYDTNLTVTRAEASTIFVSMKDKGIFEGKATTTERFANQNSSNQSHNFLL